MSEQDRTDHDLPHDCHSINWASVEPSIPVLIGPALSRSSVNALIAESGDGRNAVVAAFVAGVTTGTPFYGGRLPAPGNVLIADGSEEYRDRWHEAFTEAGVDRSRVVSFDGIKNRKNPGLDLPDDWDYLVAGIEHEKVDLVVLNELRGLMRRPKRTLQLLRLLLPYAHDSPVAFLIVHDPGTIESDRYDDVGWVMMELCSTVFTARLVIGIEKGSAIGIPSGSAGAG